MPLPFDLKSCYTLSRGKSITANAMNADTGLSITLQKFPLKKQG